MDRATIASMLRALAAIAVTTTTAHAEPTVAVADEDPVAEAHRRASELTEQAKAAARSGQCAIVELLEPQVRTIDRELYTASFAADPAVAKCKPPPPSPTYSIATRRGGVAVGVALGGGGGTQLDLRLGWVAERDLVLFGAATFGEQGDFVTVTYRVLAVGMRWWVHDVMFIDARIGRGHTHGACDPRCNDGVGSYVGSGLEVARWKHAALELEVAYAHAPDLGTMTGSIGLSFY